MTMSSKLILNVVPGFVKMTFNPKMWILFAVTIVKDGYISNVLIEINMSVIFIDLIKIIFIVKSM